VYEASAAQLLVWPGTPPTVKTLLIVGASEIPGLRSCWPEPPPADGGRGSGAVPQAVTDRMRAKFPTAAIAVLELTGPWDQMGPRTARLTGFVTPRDVKASAS
jgi:phosphohistidine phosphatase